MKIYRLIKIDMATGKTIAEESFEYAGPLALAVDGPSGTNGNDNRDSTDRSGESNSTKDVNSEDQKNFENTLNGDRNNNSNSKNKEDCGCSLDDKIETEITYQDGTTRTEWHAPNGDFCMGTGPRPPGNNPSGGTFGVGNKGGHNNNDNSVYYDGTTTPSGTPSINLTKNDIPIGGDGISGLGGSSLGFGGGGGGVPFTSPGKEVGFHDLFSDSSGSNNLYGGYSGPPDVPIEQPLIDPIDIALFAFSMLKIGQIAKFGFRTIGLKNGTTALVPKGTAPLGKWGEARLAQVLGGAGTKPAKPFSTRLGNRYVDRLVDGIAHEAKAGLNVKLTPSIEKQILKDVQLITKGRIRGAHWHFFQGADKSILDALSEQGINYTVHPIP